MKPLQLSANLMTSKRALLDSTETLLNYPNISLTESMKQMTTEEADSCRMMAMLILSKTII
jgi:hypothetical protein